MSRTCPWRAAAAVLATTVLLALAPPAGADSASDEARVLSLIQQVRTSVGAPALPVDATLTSVARDWAAKMARDGTISHNVGVGSRVSASKLSENVGMGPSIDVVHQGFLNSSGHRANMVDTGVNAVGVGVAWANGTVYVVQDYAKLNGTATPPPPANRPPAVPTQLSPAKDAVLRTATTTAQAVYSDPDGNPGRIYFAVVDEKGKVVREVWSPTVCSGCVAAVTFAALTDGFYWLSTVAHDGAAFSAVPAPPLFIVDRSAPTPPAGLKRSGTTVTGTYSDPDGVAGWLYVYVFDAKGAVVAQGWTARVCSGCTATYSLPALAGGTHHIYAFAYDGLLSSLAGPTSFGV
ncbi:MAG: hypothetical protein QOG82_2524 [Actinomycetota bacterium]|jgi:hypothetical protein|nr:hypothetical protein [Actinomycetota bacterium]